MTSLQQPLLQFPQMKRWIIRILSGLCLFIGAALVVLWIGSYWRAGSMFYTPAHTSWSIVLSRGEVQLQRWVANGKIYPGGLHAVTTQPARELLDQFAPSAYPTSYFRFMGFGISRGTISASSSGAGGAPIPIAEISQLLVPLWFILLLCLAVPLITYQRHRKAGKIPAGAQPCPNCGYDLRATPERCPECGSSVPTLQKN